MQYMHKPERPLRRLVKSYVIPVAVHNLVSALLLVLALYRHRLPASYADDCRLASYAVATMLVLNMVGHFFLFTTKAKQ